MGFLQSETSNGERKITCKRLKIKEIAKIRRGWGALCAVRTLGCKPSFPETENFENQVVREIFCFCFLVLFYFFAIFVKKEL